MRDGYAHMGRAAAMNPFPFKVCIYTDERENLKGSLFCVFRQDHQWDKQHASAT